MRKVLWASAMVLYILLAQVMRAEEIKNPVWGRDWPDPTIWLAEDGRYYSIATGLGRLACSDDLFHWQAVHDVLPLDTASRRIMHSVGRNFWAPDVTVVNGQRLAYVTVYNRAEDSNIAVLKETQPGQFRYVALITRGRETGIEDTIDPEVVTDPETGRVWLFFGSVGGIHRVELEADGMHLKPGSRYEHVAGLTVHQNPNRSRVFEGAYLHRHDGYWYLFVSSGYFGDHTYQLQVGRAKELTGTFVNRDGKPMQEGYATPVIHSDKGDFFYGPGHCGEIFTAADGQEYIFYHCHTRASQRASQRPMMIQRIQWDAEGWPYVEGGKPQ